MNLYAKLAEAQAELGDLPRDREVNAGSYRYKYVTEDAITTAIRRILSPKGVAVLVSWDEAHRDGNVTTVTGTVTFADESGTHTIGVVGCAGDTGDKGLSKAQTSGLRIALCKTFLQAGDDDGANTHPERQGDAGRTRQTTRTARNPTPAVATISQGQRRMLFAAAKDAGLADVDLRDLVAAAQGGDASTREMTVTTWQALIDDLDSRSTGPPPVPHPAATAGGAAVGDAPTAEAGDLPAPLVAGDGTPLGGGALASAPPPLELVDALVEEFDAVVEESPARAALRIAKGETSE